MISWIQKYFQKHFRLVFLVVLLAIGLPMVFIYSQSSGIGHGGHEVREQRFFHVNLANPEQSRRVYADGQLSALLRTGYRLDGADLQEYALQRLARLALADELGLPASTPAQVSAFVPTLRAFHNQQGQFDQSIYTRFGDQIKAGTLGFTVADVNRVLADDARLDAVAKLAGGPGYVLPVEVNQQLTRLDTTWTVQVASIDYASFNPAVNPTEDTLKKFHEENAFRYEVPARPKLSVIEFKAADFPPPTAPTEEEMRAFYNANIASFPVPADADKKDATPGTDNFPKVRAQVESALRDLASRQLASRAANDLTVAIYERKLAANSPALAAFLAEQHRPATPIAPFTPDNPPADRPWLASYAERINRLNQERFFSDPLPTPDGFVVLLWNETLPSYKPLFLEVRDRVLADYRESEKRRLFIERGNALKSRIKTEGIANVAAAEKLELKTYANFSLRQPAQDIPQAVLASLSSLSAGQVSDLIGLGDKGLLVYVQEKKLPDLTTASDRYTELQKQLMLYSASGTASAYVNERVEAELKRLSPAGTLP